MSRSKRKHTDDEFKIEEETPKSPACKVGDKLFFCNLNHKPGDQPHPATVAFVNDDGTVNIGYLDHNGYAKSIIGVHVAEPGCDLPEGCCCLRELPEREDKPADPEATDLETA